MGHKGGGTREGEKARQGRGGEFCAGRPRHCPPPHAAFRTRCTRTVQRVRSEAHYAAAVPRSARLASCGGPGKTGKEPLCLPPTPGPAARGHHPSCASERTLFFVLKSVRDAACGGDGPGEAFYSKLSVSFFRAALGYGQLCAGRPRPCPPPHAAFRTRCTRTVQRVRSEAHYAAAAPRLARLASGGGSGETGESAALHKIARPLRPGRRRGIMGEERRDVP